MNSGHNYLWLHAFCHHLHICCFHSQFHLMQILWFACFHCPAESVTRPLVSTVVQNRQDSQETWTSWCEMEAGSSRAWQCSLCLGQHFSPPDYPFISWQSHHCNIVVSIILHPASLCTDKLLAREGKKQDEDQWLKIWSRQDMPNLTLKMKDWQTTLRDIRFPLSQNPPFKRYI